MDEGLQGIVELLLLENRRRVPRVVKHVVVLCDVVELVEVDFVRLEVLRDEADRGKEEEEKEKDRERGSEGAGGSKGGEETMARCEEEHVSCSE